MRCCALNVINAIDEYEKTFDAEKLYVWAKTNLSMGIALEAARAHTFHLQHSYIMRNILEGKDTNMGDGIYVNPQCKGTNTPFYFSSDMIACQVSALISEPQNLSSLTHIANILAKEALLQFLADAFDQIVFNTPNMTLEYFTNQFRKFSVVEELYRHPPEDPLAQYEVAIAKPNRG